MLCAKFGADDCKSDYKSASYFSTSPQGALGAKKNKPFQEEYGLHQCYQCNLESLQYCIPAHNPSVT